MTLHTHVEAYLADLRGRGCSQHTVTTYRQALTWLERWLGTVSTPWTELEARHARALRGWLLGQHLAPTTVNAYLSTMRVFYGYLLETGAMGRNTTNPFVYHLNVKTPKRKPAFLDDHQLQAVLQAINTTPSDVRLAFLTMLYGGLRVGEVASLHPSDVLTVEGRVFLRVFGKGGVERLAPVVAPETAKALVTLAQTRRNTHPADRLFTPTRRTLQHWAWRLSKRIGVRWYCHKLRHTYATRLLSASTPIDVIQTTLGHASINTTRRYAATLPQAVLKLAASA